MNAKANQALFIKTYRLLFFLALIYFSLIMVAVPTISVLWLKGYETEFVQFALMLTLGWFLNTLIAPAFFSNLGTGELRENVISHVLVGIGSFGSGVILGTFFGGLGVVAGNVLGLGVGSIYLLYSYMARSDLRWQDEMFPAGLSVFSVICALCVVTANVYPLLNNTFTGTIVSFVICAVGLTAAAYSLAPRNLVSHFR